MKGRCHSSLRSDILYNMELRYYYLIWLAITGLVTFFTYGYDKAKAESRGWRVPEVTLHLMSLIGGFIGGWLGREIFRHKTRKVVFTLVLLLSTGIHLAIAYRLFLA